MIALALLAALAGVPHHNPFRHPPHPAHAVARAPIAHLQATEREFSIVLSRATLPAGRVSLEGGNLGEDPHDLRLRAADGSVQPLAALSPGATQTVRLDLAPGRYTLFCGLPEHEGLGMHAPLTITAR